MEAAELKQKLDFLQENVDRVRAEMRKLTAEYRDLEAGDRNAQGIIEARRQEIASRGRRSPGSPYIQRSWRSG